MTKGIPAYGTCDDHFLCTTESARTHASYNTVDKAGLLAMMRAGATLSVVRGGSTDHVTTIQIEALCAAAETTLGSSTPSACLGEVAQRRHRTGWDCRLRRLPSYTILPYRGERIGGRDAHTTLRPLCRSRRTDEALHVCHRWPIDLGFNTWRKDERLRLYGINAPEPRSATRKAGLAATQALRDALEGKQVVICTIKDCADSFGRYLARVFVVEGEPVSINAAMILAGHAGPAEVWVPRGRTGGWRR